MEQTENYGGKGPSDEEKNELHALRTIVEETPQAKDVYQLYLQLKKALPIHNFKGLHKALDENGLLYFRDETSGLEVFEGLIPDFIFPIEDEKGLIIRLAEFVRLIPEYVGYDPSSPKNIKFITQRNFLSSITGREQKLNHTSNSAIMFGDKESSIIDEIK